MRKRFCLVSWLGVTSYIHVVFFSCTGIKADFKPSKGWFPRHCVTRQTDFQNDVRWDDKKADQTLFHSWKQLEMFFYQATVHRNLFIGSLTGLFSLTLSYWTMQGRMQVCKRRTKEGRKKIEPCAAGYLGSCKIVAQSWPREGYKQNIILYLLLQYLQNRGKKSIQIHVDHVRTLRLGHYYQQTLIGQLSVGPPSLVHFSAFLRLISLQSFFLGYSMLSQCSQWSGVVKTLEHFHSKKYSA